MRQTSRRKMVPKAGKRIRHTTLMLILLGVPPPKKKTNNHRMYAEGLSRTHEDSKIAASVFVSLFKPV